MSTGDAYFMNDVIHKDLVHMIDMFLNRDEDISPAVLRICQ